MFSPRNGSGPPVLSELQALKKELRSLNDHRLVQDYSFASAVQHDLEQIQANHTQQLSELRADQALRRAETYLELLGEGATRAERDAASLELTVIEQRDKANLDTELQRLSKEADVRNEKQMLSIENQRNQEDRKYHDILTKLSGGRFSPKNMLGMIVVIDKMITNWPFEDKTESQIDFEDMTDDSMSGFGSPPASSLGVIARKTVASFGLITPDNTPLSSDEPKFPSLQPAETPTRPSRKRPQLSATAALSVLQSSITFGPTLANSSTSAPKLPPTFEFRVGVASAPAKKAHHKVVIDLTSNSDDELPVPENQPASSAPSVKTPAKSKRKAKKPLVSAAIRSAPSATSVIQDDLQISGESLASVVQEVSKKLLKIDELAPAEEPGPIEDPTLGIFDSESDYSETESRKRRRLTFTAPQGPHRNRTGALTMSELIEHPAADLSFAKGTTFKVWSRRLYLPRKLMKFSVNFIRAIKDNGEISRFNDDLSPVGFCFLRKAHTFVPVIGHNRKEDVHPEWVLEEDEVLHAQYNHDHALVCFTKTVGVYRDVLVRFATREDMWNFVAVASMEMEMVVYQK